MAKLFANKFNLDSLPDPTKPSPTPVQASNIRIEPVEEKPLNTQALNAQLYTIDNQKANMASNDEILAKQGVRKSSATQYVSATKVEPFGDKVINQGGVDLKKSTDQYKKFLLKQGGIEDILKNVSSFINPLKFGDRVLNQGQAKVKSAEEVKNAVVITNPNITVAKIGQGDKVVNPKIIISKTDQTTKITDPKIEITKLAVGDKITNPHTIVNKVKVSDVIKTPKIVISKTQKDQFITDPKITITKTQNANYITDPKLDIQKVSVGDKITNPNIKVKPIDAGDRIVDPNTKIKKVQEGDKITNPNIEVAPIKVGDRITNPNVKIIRVTANELITDPKLEIAKIVPGDRIVNPKTVISKVEPGDRITMPNMVLSQMRTSDVTTYKPSIKGVGVTKFFPRSISLKDRIQQPTLGTTRHLPEFILSDFNTGVITITNPSVVTKLSAIKTQRVNYEKFILKQGGLENELRGIYSYINILKFNKKKYNQGSITIKNIQKDIPKNSPVDIKKLSKASIITNPKIQVVKVVGSLITDPKIYINVDQKVSIITDPKIKVTIPKGDLIRVPETEIKDYAKYREFITDPQIKVTVVGSKRYTIDPKIKTKQSTKSGLLTVIPKIELTQPTKEGSAVKNPRVQITKAKIGSLVKDPKTTPRIVTPGSRTVIPKLTLTKVTTGALTRDPQIKVVKVEAEDNKKSSAKDVEAFGDVKYDPTAVFPGDPNSISQTTGQIVTITQYDPLAVFPTSENSIPDFSSTQTGVSYNNQYTEGSAYDYKNQESALKAAGSTALPTLTVSYFDGSVVTQQKQASFPATVVGDPSTPGGYKALSYEQIQKRAQNSNRRSLDFTYSEATTGDEANAWRTRLGMPSTGEDTMYKSAGATGRDFVTIKVGNVQFRSYLKSFSDSISANYSDVTYIGRPDVLKVFKNTTRQIV